jgi:AraC-like DNA-binding protein
MKRKEDLNKVVHLLSGWVTTIKSHNAAGYYDINKISEGIAIRLLNEIYGYSLKNLNIKRGKYPGVDLGDNKSKIAFQITTTMNPMRFYKGLAMFAGALNQKYISGIRFLVLSEDKKPKLKKKKCKEIYWGFDPEKHIITVQDLLKEIRKIYNNERERFYRIKEIVEEEFSRRIFKEEIENIGEKKGDDRSDIGKSENYEKKIFISYSHHDKEFVSRLTVDLENTGIRVSLAVNDIYLGDYIAEKLGEGISKADFFLLVISSNSVKSNWVEHEYKTALNAQLPQGISPKIIPILIENVQLPILLKDIKYADFSTGYDRGLVQLLKAIMIESVTKDIMKLGSGEVEITPLDKEFLKDLHDIVERNLADPDFTIYALAKELHIGRSSLFRRLRAITGMTPNEYIRNYRLERGARLLKENYGNVTEVAMAVGFETPQYFAQCFKERYKQSPTAYKLAYLEDTLNLSEKVDAEALEQFPEEYLVDELRNVVAEGLYKDGREYLQKIVKIFPRKKESLIQEFGFIYDFKNPNKDEENWKQKEAKVNWRRKVWQILSANCDFELITSEERETQANIKDKEKSGVVEGKEKSKKDTQRKKTPGEKGEELEKAVFELLEMFFDTCEFEKRFQPISSRQQDKGRQSGHDLKFVVGTSENREMRILIECKNYSKKIKLGDIADKLMAAKAYHQNIVPIDHWILVSPNTYVSSELHELLESWEKHGEYPFKVQAWTKDERVEELFGLIPEIYDRIITKSVHKAKYKKWTKEDRKKVIEFWKEKLAPPLRLPKGWAEYLRKPEKFLRQGEPQELEDLYDCHVPMNCKDETGALIHGKKLEDKVNEWLEKPVEDHPTLILLGDFGDGKTTFSYIFSRKLAEQFLKSPSTCWLPVRFSLKDFSIKNVNTSRDFLRRRLEEFGADIDSWDTLAKSKYKLLAILDGFDEMSKKMDHNTILDKIEQIIECYQNEFSGMKVLITSRKHFFENQQHKNQLLQRIKNPQLLMLAPIKRTETEGHLREYSKSINEEAKFKILLNRHDPIGLASKPLYLEMVKGSLKDLPDKDLDELILYETYIQQSLERKGYFLEDEKLETSPENIIENMKGILESVAIQLHQSDEEFIYLSDIHGPQRLLRGLWKMSAPTDCTADDEIRRIAVRSLLKRVDTGGDTDGKKFPVDFCHRSMREYFVARAVCKMVAQNLEKAKHFLRSCCLSYEIIFFASKMMKKNTGFDYTENLWQLILKTKYHKDKEKIKVGSLGSNAANLLYQYSGKIPQKNWSHLVLDWVDFSGADLSGKDFSHTSFHYANLDNVNFTNANFSHCDLTGVRLEEASPVQAVAVSQDESIYALYEDGVIREWIHNRVRSPYPVSLEKIETTNDIRLVAQPGNDLTLIDNNQLIFYDKDNEKIIQKARIDLKSVLKPINAFHDSLLIIEDKNNRYSLQLINLEKQSVIQSVSVKAFTLCAHLGSSAFIIYDEKDGLQIVNPLSGETKTISRIEPAKINCMATCQCEEFPDQWRLAIGREDGSITIFNIDLSTIEMEEVLKYKCHEKAVRDIAFIDENRVVSGGVDMKVLLTKIERDETARYISTEFKLNLQCKDMKVTGIKPDENRLFLEKIIAKTSGIELK